MVQLSSSDEELAIAFLLTNQDIYRILQACPRLRSIHLNPKIFEDMPCVGQTLMHMQEVSVVVDEAVSQISFEMGSGRVEKVLAGNDVDLEMTPP